MSNPSQRPEADLPSPTRPDVRRAAVWRDPTTTGKRCDIAGLPLGARRCSFIHLATLESRWQAKPAQRREPQTPVIGSLPQQCESRASGGLAAFQSIALPLLGGVRVDGAALGFTALAAIGAAMLFGLAPSLKIAGGRVQSSLKESARGSSAGRAHSLFRSSLVVSELALA